MSKAKDLQDIIEIEKFAKSQAGDIIVKSLNKGVSDIMFKFVGELNNPSLNKYIALSCELKEILELIKLFTGAGDLRKVIEESTEE